MWGGKKLGGRTQQKKKSGRLAGKRTQKRKKLVNSREHGGTKTREKIKRWRTSSRKRGRENKGTHREKEGGRGSNWGVPTMGGGKNKIPIETGGINGVRKEGRAQEKKKKTKETIGAGGKKRTRKNT